MLLIGFPVDITYWILLEKSRMENLSYNRDFFCIEPFSCFLEPEKHARCKVPENFVRESWNRIRFVDIERYPKSPGSDSDRDRTRSAFGEDETRLLFFQYLSRFEYTLYELEWIEHNSNRPSAQELVGRDRSE